MKTHFAGSPDGTQIAYDRSGAGPVVVLLHGGGGSRQEWHAAGYVERLQKHFTVITLDLRGHGESDLPSDPVAYTIEKQEQDILAVADACRVERFSLWGMSYGGKVGRYLAVHTERVDRLVLIGTLLGAGVEGELRQDAIEFCAHWPPILQALQAGDLELDALSAHDQEFLRNFNVPAMTGWVPAMLAWSAVEPADFRCPVLWVIGTEDRHAMGSLKEHEQALAGSRVQVELVQCLDHEQVFDEIERIFAVLLSFMQV